MYVDWLNVISCMHSDGGSDSNGPCSVPAKIARGQCCPSCLLNAYLTRGGCCEDSCLMKYGDLARRRALTLSRLDKRTRKAVVAGMLAMIRNKSGSRNTFHYRLDWSSPICKDAFCAVIGTNPWQLWQGTSQCPLSFGQEQGGLIH